MYDHLRSVKRKKEDPYNDATIDVDGSARYLNPINASITFYDWIVRTALECHIEWHMFLMSLGDWTELMLKNMTFTGERWSDEREFPNVYFYNLYEIVDKFSGWINFVARSKTIKIPGIKGDIDKNANILQFTVETMSVYLKHIANSDIPERYKVYLADMVWRSYFELLNSSRKDLKQYGEHLLNQMFEDLTRYGSDFDYKQLKLMLVSFCLVDIVGMHTSNAFKIAEEIETRLMAKSKEMVFYHLYGITDFDMLLGESKKYLSDRVSIDSDGIYIPGYYKNKMVFSFKELQIDPSDFR